MPTIERRLQQVDKYFITPNYIESESIDYFIKIENILEAGIKIIQFRSKNLNIEDYSRVSKKIYCLCRKYNSIFIINDFKNFNLNKYCDGIQLTSKNLKNINLVNFNKKYILIGSCHNVQEIEMCNNLQLNLILISPVFDTNSKKGIGWLKFKELVKKSDIPAFALGGLSYTEHIENVKFNGGVGVAASSYFYNLFNTRK
jgi:thiamine-phosphate pyrophosphorylase